MAKKTQVQVVDASEVEEVQQLLGVERELQALIQSNPEFYTKLTTLTKHRNELLASADKKVRGMGVSCGPFVLLSESIKIDDEKLFEELGEDNFKEIGGYTETVTVYKTDRQRVLSYAESGQIPDEVVAVCIKNEKRYKKIDAYNLP